MPLQAATLVLMVQHMLMPPEEHIPTLMSGTQILFKQILLQQVFYPALILFVLPMPMDVLLVAP
jgi:hypothetical protein